MTDKKPDERAKDGLGKIFGEIEEANKRWQKENVIFGPGREYEGMPVKAVRVLGREDGLGDLVKMGSFVAIRPVDSEKTYLGIYLGDFPTESTVIYNIPSQSISVSQQTNPAIFVPELKRVVRGYESWWGEIQDENQLRQITDEDIQNIWYVKALKQIAEARKHGH